VLAFFPTTVVEDVYWRKPVVGSIFCVFCGFGILAVFSPSKCGKVLGTQKPVDGPESINAAPSDSPVVLRGHHPTCGNYEAHVFRVNEKTYCAACIGLLIGGLLALAIALLYFFADWQFAENNALMVLLGVAGIVFGLFQFKFTSTIRLAANIVFVVSALLVLIGVDGLVQSLVLDLFVFSLIVFWLYTRILLSQLDHEIICSKCDAERCEYRK
jgi:hypothetical protein